ncbi:MAG: TetR/AcrR family transcriptional regulator [Phenylobacterium sp.]|nr:TetR/AcrR family transcriptional regulator [Phenylobacterium sp.]
MLVSAAKIVVDQGFFPVSMEGIARDCGVSKGLVYAHFPTQESLANGLLGAHLTQIEPALAEAGNRRDLLNAALAAADAYFDHIAGNGLLLNILIGSSHALGRLDTKVLRQRDRLVLPLLRRARRELGLTTRETLAAFNLILAIPEEAGRLAFTGRMAPAAARGLMRLLVKSAIDSIQPSRAL